MQHHAVSPALPPSADPAPNASGWVVDLFALF
jgi:hypothetical protein